MGMGVLRVVRRARSRALTRKRERRKDVQRRGVRMICQCGVSTVVKIIGMTMIFFGYCERERVLGHWWSKKIGEAYPFPQRL